MKQPYLVSAALALLPAFAIVLVATGNVPRIAEADSVAARCTDASFYFPADGIVGWTYSDPASTDRNAAGNPTAHTGIDVFADNGAGAPVYAPADGVVSRYYGSQRANLVLPNVVNAVNGEVGVEVYLSHVNHSLTVGQEFKAGDVIGTQAGDHVHLSVGAFVGFDDREISQTQDPSPYFNAALSYTTDHDDRQHATDWCFEGAPAASLASAPAAAPIPVTHVVASGDTLYGIADQYGTTVDEIAAANALDDLDFLSLGQEIIIPGTVSSGSITASTEPSAPAETPAATSTGGEYVVQDGDTLYAIAEALGVDGQALIDLNAMIDPDFLSIGDVLVVP